LSEIETSSNQRTLSLGWLLTLLTFLKLVLNAASRFVYPFLPELARGLGVDLTTMGRLLSVRWGFTLSVPLAVGIIDRRRRSRRLLLAALVIFGIGSLVTAVTGVLLGAVIGFALMGLGKPLFDVGTQTYVSERVPYQKRARSLGILELSWAGGLLLGAPVAGWLINTWDWTVPFWVLGSVALLGVGAVMLLLEPSDHIAGEAVVGIDRSLGQVLPFLFSALLVGFGHEMVLVVLGAWLEDAFAMTLLGLAAVGSLLGVAELSGEGAMVAFTDRIGKRNASAIGMLAAAAALVALGFLQDDLALGVGTLFVASFSFEFAIVSSIPLASEMRPSRRARFLSTWLVAAGAGRVLGDLIGPGIFGGGGMSTISWVAAGAAALGAALLLGGVREVGAGQSGVVPYH
jgi:predicted MFS family arabinose efflux permease